jgi:hypothetical protein
MGMAIVKPGQLFRPRHEPKTVGRFCQRLNQQMDMVRHEAVCNECKLLIACGALNLQHHGSDDRWTREDALSRMAAECQEVSIQADVVEGS